MKNWKSNLAFIAFVGSYVYAVIETNISMVELTGYFTLVGMLFMMLRSEDLGTIVKELATGLKDRLSK